MTRDVVQLVFRGQALRQRCMANLQITLRLLKVSPGCLPKWADCGELGIVVLDLPGCNHFTDLDKAILCDVCLRNHTELCEADGD